MKTRVLYLFAALIIFASCTNEEVTTVIPVSDEFYCSIENEESTRTSLDQNSNVTWSAEDQLVIFKKSSIPSRYQISESHVGKTSGSFYKVNSDEFNAGSELDHNVALYPYQENVEITKLDSDSPTTSYKISGYNFPAEQTYVENSFANGAFPMAAVSDNYDLTFRNICGGIKLQLKGTQKITSIKIEGKNSEKLAGNAEVVVYSDENLNPAITMTSNAMTSVILNCGAGVQLNENSATEFIIAIPPVLFNKGLIVTISDSEGKFYAIKTDKANSVLRSSLLLMPIVKVGGNNEPEEDEDIIPVTGVSLNTNWKSFTLPVNCSLGLTAYVTPIDATIKEVVWSTDNPSVVSIEQNGNIKTINQGEANIYAEAGGCYATCKISVISQRNDLIDYIDEYGINQGKGVALGNVIWAPVNCGYKQHSETNKGFPYGKLYQWGRRYGQGYSTQYDESVPEEVQGPISYASGSKEEYSNTVFLSSSSDWISPQDDCLWNSGTPECPVKTKSDPCPNGWRVPTHEEMYQLSDLVLQEERDENGFKVYDVSIYTLYYYDTIQKISIYLDLPKVSLQLPGYRPGGSGGNSARGQNGYYWSSCSHERSWSTEKDSYIFKVGGSGGGSGLKFQEETFSRSCGLSVRCVQE